MTGVLQGGRDYSEQVLLVPWGEPREPLRPGSETQLPGSFSLGLGPQAGQANNVRPGRPGAPGPSRQPAARPGRGKGGKGGKDGVPPWPGRLPGLAPAIVHQPPLPALMVDEEGNQVTVGSRGAVSARPARLRVSGGALMEIGTWAGPWPVEERWWDEGGRRRARFQVCTIDGAAYLLAREGRRWWVEATYD